MDPAPRSLPPLARLPVFLSLLGKRAIVAGGTQAAAWKVELLSAAGAAVDVFAAEICDQIRALAKKPPGGAITILKRPLQADDVNGAALLIAACDNDDDAAMFARLARAAGVPVNVIDRPEFCDFSFGAIVNRSPLVIGISTDGAAPVFAQAIRSRLEAMIPAGFAQWLEAARRLRPRIKALDWTFGDRRQFWARFARAALARPDRGPLPAEVEAWIAAVGKDAGHGAVTIVALTADDPDVLTLRAVRALQLADIVISDAAISEAVLDFARREAAKLVVDEAKTPDELATFVIGRAKEGKQVVLLRNATTASVDATNAVIAACARDAIPVEAVGETMVDDAPLQPDGAR
jgi:uroporphyrin-III C-methyltransferase / precorrin-2 dehydrogenase / sirohydrochlorin ferrochelatase